VEEDSGPKEEPDKQEIIDGWTVYALRFQLSAMGAAMPPPEADQRMHAEAYWQALVDAGKEHDEPTRRWLLVPTDSTPEEAAKIWLSCLTGRELPEGPLQPILRSGEVLCDLVNKIRPGSVPKIARSEILECMSENRRNARCRENIGCYVDACAEIGCPQRELFITADLFDGKNWKAVLKNLHGFARYCHYDVEGFAGPHIGIRKKDGTGRKEKEQRSGPSWKAVGMLASMSSSRSLLGSMGSSREMLGSTSASVRLSTSSSKPPLTPTKASGKADEQQAPTEKMQSESV